MLFWLLFSGKSVKIHPALSVHQYMARANDINNTECQRISLSVFGSVVNRSNRDTTYTVVNRSNRDTTYTVVNRSNRDTTYTVVNRSNRDTTYTVVNRSNRDTTYTVVNRSNRDTTYTVHTVYYGRIFCTFS